MEPSEAPNLDNQYKYYWEGDLCGPSHSRGTGCVRGPALPWGEGPLAVPGGGGGGRGVQELAPSFFVRLSQ